MTIYTSKIVPPSLLPAQPAIDPARELPALGGILHWWTPHQGTTWLDVDGRLMAQPFAGSVPLGGDVAEATIPMSFRQVTIGGNAARPPYGVLNPTNLWRATVALPASGWVSLVAAFRPDAGSAGQLAIANLNLNAATAMRYLPVGTSAGVNLAGPTQVNTNFPGGAATGVPSYGIVAINPSGGQIKHSLNGAAPQSETNTLLNGLAYDPTSELRFGARNPNVAFTGDWLDIGIFAGDLFSTGMAAQLAYLDRYFAHCYGI